MLYINSSEYICFAVRDGVAGPSICYNGATVNDGQWHHAAGIRNVATDTAYLYLDGKLVNSANDTTTTTTTNNVDISIGNGGASYLGEDFNGVIDDVRIYSYARTAGQIVEDMNAGHPAPGSPIGSAVAYWALDEGYGTTAYDNSVNANNLTLSTASWTNSGKLTD